MPGGLLNQMILISLGCFTYILMFYKLYVLQIILMWQHHFLTKSRQCLIICPPNLRNHTSSLCITLSS